jgi:hypothetical protein
MSETLHFFSSPQSQTAVALPFHLTERLEEWAYLHKLMAQEVPEEFSRDEWAYLAMFIQASNLRLSFIESFGEPLDPANARPSILARPRGSIAIWLPNNVSLLGPLVLILASLTGASIRVKAGSRSDDLTTSFVEFAIRRLKNGALAAYLRHQVKIDKFDRTSSLNQEMAAGAKVRIIFGSDEAVSAIQSLPHPADSVAVVFGDHTSEAWVESAALTDDQLFSLIKVFAIYGQAGCTSPRRVVVLNGTPDDSRSLRQRLELAWPKVIRKDVAMRAASNNVLERQTALAQGWDAILAPRHAAVLASGPAELGRPEGVMTLAVVSASVEEALKALPPNIQTIGHCLSNASDPSWLRLVARSRIKRFVPISGMHHFGPIWDGANYWRQFFEEVAVRA